jgi:1,2-phenylacetyl-CoA epoxidase catalytic subunit
MLVLSRSRMVLQLRLRKIMQFPPRLRNTELEFEWKDTVIIGFAVKTAHIQNVSAQNVSSTKRLQTKRLRNKTSP